MSIYNTGTVQLKTGSAQVKGETGLERFLTYASAGYLFKVESEGTWYQIAAITNATNFTLSSRYDNSSYRTARTSENIATVTTATKIYSGTLDNYPVIQSNIVINASIERFTDNGGGVLTGNGTPSGSGTIDYDTGVWSITLGTDITATAIVTASYLSGDTRTGVSYQIVTDYTTNFSFPEMNVNDTNFQYIFTKAARMIDSALYNASINSLKSNTATVSNASINTLKVSDNVKVVNYVRVGANKYVFSGDSTTSADIIAEATALVATPIKGSLYMGVTDIWKFNSDTTATKL